MIVLRIKVEVIISIHALCEEGDDPQLSSNAGTADFYPRPLRGGRRYSSTVHLRVCTISIHALCEEGDAAQDDPMRRRPISIHALCEEGDPAATPSRTGRYDFYPRPLRGGRLCRSFFSSSSTTFLSTPSARRATLRPSCWKITRRQNFYPRPLRGGRRDALDDVAHGRRISIHALCEEGDRRSPGRTRPSVYFYPRPLRGGRQRCYTA